MAQIFIWIVKLKRVISRDKCSSAQSFTPWITGLGEATAVQRFPQRTADLQKSLTLAVIKAVKALCFSAVFTGFSCSPFSTLLCWGVRRHCQHRLWHRATQEGHSLPSAPCGSLQSGTAHRQLWGPRQNEGDKPTAEVNYCVYLEKKKIYFAAGTFRLLGTFSD